ncbi:uncharacterized protein L3040_001338 [Drepanopeziza brunnea f. sp. 'multigermtubi']|uniref:uncharacterized protein n=1 Tax=Drepanopeziza brunnea f. sp. 'multigermtubi' TaxID=698441 RepID=UPI00238C173E|nr:hypothetical protein L3040_001338 [Drepanopeziza brunnea f. sp. 'multigermtubi']
MLLNGTGGLITSHTKTIFSTTSTTSTTTTTGTSTTTTQRLPSFSSSLHGFSIGVQSGIIVPCQTRADKPSRRLLEAVLEPSKGSASSSDHLLARATGLAHHSCISPPKPNHSRQLLSPGPDQAPPPPFTLYPPPPCRVCLTTHTTGFAVINYSGSLILTPLTSRSAAAKLQAAANPDTQPPHSPPHDTALHLQSLATGIDLRDHKPLTQTIPSNAIAACPAQRD